MWQLLRKAPKRFARSMTYCRDAFGHMVEEESFRLELIALGIVAVVMLLCGWPWWKKLILFGGCLLIPLTETINSAIEDVCDLITTEKNEKVKSAKDKGALAVLTAIGVNALLLVALLLVDD